MKAATFATLLTLLVSLNSISPNQDPPFESSVVGPVQPGPPESPTQLRLRVGDPVFLAEAFSAVRLEVELAVAARDRAVSDAMIQFSDRVSRDFTGLLSRIAEMADRRGVLISPELKMKHLEVANQVRAVFGPEFDPVYLRATIQHLRRVDNLFQFYSQSSPDPDVRAFAVQAIGLVQADLHLAESLARRFFPKADPKPALESKKAVPRRGIEPPPPSRAAKRATRPRATMQGFSAPDGHPRQVAKH